MNLSNVSTKWKKSYTRDEAHTNLGFFLISRESERERHTQKITSRFFFSFIYSGEIALHCWVEHTQRLFRLWSFVENYQPDMKQAWGKLVECEWEREKNYAKNFLPENISDCNKNLILDMKFYCLKSNRGSCETFNAFPLLISQLFTCTHKENFSWIFHHFSYEKKTSTRENFTSLHTPTQSE